MLLIALLSLTTSAVAKGLRPHSISLSLNGIDYFVSPSPETKLPSSLHPSVKTADSFAFAPVTVVGNSTTAQEDLNALFSEWKQEDDVWQSGFLETVIVKNSADCKSGANTFHDGIESVVSCADESFKTPPGPYFL